MVIVQLIQVFKILILLSVIQKRTRQIGRVRHLSANLDDYAHVFGGRRHKKYVLCVMRARTNQQWVVRRAMHVSRTRPRPPVASTAAPATPGIRAMRARRKACARRVFRESTRHPLAVRHVRTVYLESTIAALRPPANKIVKIVSTYKIQKLGRTSATASQATRKPHCRLTGRIFQRKSARGLLLLVFTSSSGVPQNSIAITLVHFHR